MKYDFFHFDLCFVMLLRISFSFYFITLLKLSYILATSTLKLRQNDTFPMSPKITICCKESWPGYGEALKLYDRLQT